jgi:L-cysteine/cystine lyase
VPDAPLRAAFPVCERVAYLNAGTCGPLPHVARAAADELLDVVEREGRAGAYFERTLALHGRLREGYARAIDGSADDVALVTSTSDGIVRVVAGLGLGEGDEVLTSDAEHPGLLGPLLAARERFGITIRAVPLEALADAVGPRTRLVAASHVGWLRGDVAPVEALAALGDDVPVLLDGAQGAGALDLDVGDLGCAFYAAAGQKWLCGPMGTGLLWIDPAWQERLEPIGPTYLSFADPARALERTALHPGARRHDTSALPGELAAPAVASLELLEEHGWLQVRARARARTREFAAALRDTGRDVPERGDTTLVAFTDDDPPATAKRLAGEGVVLRGMPGTPWLRASVGAWNDESDLERLLAALAAG